MLRSTECFTSMTYCCRLSEGRFSLYLACYSRDFYSSVSKSLGKKQSHFLTLSSKLFIYVWGPWNTCPVPQRARRRDPPPPQDAAELRHCCDPWQPHQGLVIQQCCASTTHWSCWGSVWTSRDEIPTSPALMEKSFHKEEGLKGRRNPVASQADFVWITLYMLADRLLQTVCMPRVVLATTWLPWCHLSAKLSVITSVSNNNIRQTSIQ